MENQEQIQNLNWWEWTHPYLNIGNRALHDSFHNLLYKIRNHERAHLFLGHIKRAKAFRTPECFTLIVSQWDLQSLTPEGSRLVLSIPLLDIRNRIIALAFLSYYFFNTDGADFDHPSINDYDTNTDAPDLQPANTIPNLIIQDKGNFETSTIPYFFNPSFRVNNPQLNNPQPENLNLNQNQMAVEIF